MAHKRQQNVTVRNQIVTMNRVKGRWLPSLPAAVGPGGGSPLPKLFTLNFVSPGHARPRYQKHHVWQSIRQPLSRPQMGAGARKCRQRAEPRLRVASATEVALTASSSN